MSQLGHYQLGYIETLSRWNQKSSKNYYSFLLTIVSTLTIIFSMLTNYKEVYYGYARECQSDDG